MESRCVFLDSLHIYTYHSVTVTVFHFVQRARQHDSAHESIKMYKIMISVYFRLWAPFLIPRSFANRRPSILTFFFSPCVAAFLSASASASSRFCSVAAYASDISSPSSLLRVAISNSRSVVYTWSAYAASRLAGEDSELRFADCE